jgi:hypothetical protein
MAVFSVCPPSFTNVPSVNGCYKVATEGLQWSAAGVWCMTLDKDAHLVIINNAEEQTAVANLIKGMSGM